MLPNFNNVILWNFDSESCKIAKYIPMGGGEKDSIPFECPVGTISPSEMRKYVLNRHILFIGRSLSRRLAKQFTKFIVENEPKYWSGNKYEKFKSRDKVWEMGLFFD